MSKEHNIAKHGCIRSDMDKSCYFMFYKESCKQNTFVALYIHMPVQTIGYEFKFLSSII